MSEVIRVGRRYTIVIPKFARRELGIKEGDLLLLRVEGQKIVLEPKRSNPFKVLEDVIGDVYSEDRDERVAEEWLKNASS
ncbi:AbrB/MazE/SpoVT family DNA-binding domain-containing protein [Infirmifilum lucidum]|uniref:AbrB/MazE/SpoVT family DNA-binding domain-containing protein n=1 Tax=Infirmifilum lucidum TaxID=2776706 RepID=A0A7L9FG54_9CREN|nr:AbrB/MazE/SpoVT family DNA-binding domain-containing protein [Infirmifilum lucidum]QOJ78677.1 AbrB/MazE/SpoVT family DNA-binding domain-containing protein [Infirmifilum lucidum]